jgi:hypothetical protein
MWFITFAVDNSIYLKQTTCSDINMNDKSHVCFAVNESYALVDCTVEQMRPVICYMFSLNLAGIGIAYSIANLCLAFVDVYYIILMKLIVKCGTPFIASIRFFALIVTLVGFGVWWGLFRTKGQYIRYDYFGYGLVPMRISQSILALLTTVIVTIVPPWSLDIKALQTYHDLAVPKPVTEKACSACCNPKSKRAYQGL